MRIDYPRRGRAGWQRFVPSRRQTAAGLGAGAALVLVLFGVAYASTDLGKLNDLAVGQAVVVRYADGSEIGRLGALNRVSVPLSAVPQSVQHAVLAAEDRGFYSEPGISLRGIGRALVNNLTGGDKQGGSTITQQYAKNAYLSQQRTYTRKLRELVIAIKLDQSESKDHILEGYLNTIYFGRGAYGIQTASQAYFGVGVGKLSVAQAAVLAAVIRAPGLYDPEVHPDLAQGRWAYVLDGMVKKGWLTSEQRAALRFPTRFAARKGPTANQLGGPKGYILQAVQEELAQHGIGADQLAARGLDVTTTLSRKAQQAAQQAVSAVIPTTPPDVHVGIAAVEPGTGKVKALYGGRDYVTRAFDDATQAQRQPGSSFKPFVLTTALANGVSLKSRFDGRSPQQFPGDPKPVRNFHDEQCPDCDLVKATADSVNTVYYRLGLKAGGPDAVVQTAKAAGITSPIDPRRSGGNVFLGSGSTVTTNAMQMADAYATFADRGKHAKPYLVQKVKDRTGSTVYSAADPSAQRALPADAVADATYAMEHVLTDGTGKAARLDRPAAGKTGTVQGNTDAWFCGFVPQLAAAVHLYRDGTDKPLRGLAGFGEVTGGTVPARIWHDLMTAALEGSPVQQLPPPVFGGTAINPSPSPSATPSTTPSATPSATPSSATPSPTPSAVKVTLSPAPAPTLSVPPPPPPSSPPPPATPPPSPTGSPTASP